MANFHWQGKGSGGLWGVGGCGEWGVGSKEWGIRMGNVEWGIWNGE